MGVSREVLLAEARNVLEQPLNARGYFIEELPAGGEEDLLAGRWEFSFEKKPVAPDEVFLIISFSPGGFSEEHLFEVSVMLRRSTFRDPFRPTPGGKMMFAAELAAFFLDKLDDPRLRWHFVNAEQVREAYSDILDRLLRYGIRLMENPKVTWGHWMGKRPFTTDFWRSDDPDSPAYRGED
jgi:hypothetical protein